MARAIVALLLVLIIARLPAAAATLSLKEIREAGVII